MELLQVKVMNPHQILFQGDGLAVSSKNSLGKFDILPEHANFITLIENQPIQIIKSDKRVVSFTFSQAIIMNIKNQVTVFAEPQTL